MFGFHNIHILKKTLFLHYGYRHHAQVQPHVASNVLPKIAFPSLHVQIILEVGLKCEIMARFLL